jgi:hypothetical protein
MRYSMMGMWDNRAEHGPITGTGPNFAKAMRMFNKRVAREGEVGVWRKAPAQWKKNKGTKIDPDWYVIQYASEDN